MRITSFFCEDNDLGLRPQNPARVQAIGASFASRSGKRRSVQPLGAVQQTGRGALGPRYPQESSQCSLGTNPGQPARAGDSSTVSPQSWEDGDKSCREKGLGAWLGAGRPGCPGVGTPRGARVGETLARLMPISSSTTELPQGLERFPPPKLDHPAVCLGSASRRGALGVRVVELRAFAQPLF